MAKIGRDFPRRSVVTVCVKQLDCEQARRIGRQRKEFPSTAHLGGVHTKRGCPAEASRRASLRQKVAEKISAKLAKGTIEQEETQLKGLPFSKVETMDAVARKWENFFPEERIGPPNGAGHAWDVPESLVILIVKKLLSFFYRWVGDVAAAAVISCWGTKPRYVRVTSNED
ncbi:unnamed protein product [Ectocarpus sp. 13 AM-2016]